MFSPQGESLRIFGKHGPKRGELFNPWGLCLDKEGRVIVGDQDNHRIQVFSREGQYLMHFGSVGHGNGQLRCPKTPTMDMDGNIVISDLSNDRICVLVDKTTNKIQKSINLSGGHGGWSFCNKHQRP